jgi:hypothetical protein
MAPSRSGASREARKIAVGPSAPPMIAMADASCSVKSKPGRNVQRNRPDQGREDPELRRGTEQQRRRTAIRAPKSVSAPTPMKISSGKMPVSTPTV